MRVIKWYERFVENKTIYISVVTEIYIIYKLTVVFMDVNNEYV